MRTSRYTIARAGACLASVLGILLLGTAVAGAGVAAPSTLWVKTLEGADRSWYQHHDATACWDRVVIGLVEEDHDPNTPPANRLWVYVLSRDGDLEQTIEVPLESLETIEPKLVQNLRLACGRDGGLGVAFNTPGGVPWFALVDPGGAVGAPRRVGDGETLLKPQAFFARSRGGYVLAGYAPRSALALALDDVGFVRSTLSRVGSEVADLESEPTAGFVSGCEMPDAAVVLAANVPKESGQLSVRVVALDAEGAVRSEAVRTGRFGSVYCSKSGVTLVYDRHSAGEQSFWAEQLSPGLEPLFEVEVSNAGGMLPSSYQISGARENGSWVLGSNQNRAFLARLDSSGQLVWTLRGLDWGMSHDFRLALGASGEVFVVFSDYLEKSFGFRRKVKLAKVTE